ncbi:MAG: nucleotidyltransferase domain-containing protein [Candidatus Sumerlaeota bacterium]|nr:nucleotidyltransferase domain-containing protein [Candidatus Sumerlaeota bacterium]
MASEQIMNILKRYWDRLRKEKLPVQGLVLYGSYARGEARRDSDIDVLVLLDNQLTPKDIANIWPKLGLMTIGIDTRIETWPVSARRFESDEVSPLIITARSEGIRIA